MLSGIHSVTLPVAKAEPTPLENGPLEPDLPGPNKEPRRACLVMIILII